MDSNLEYEVGPDNIENLEGDEEGVEDIVTREHWNVGTSIMKGGVENIKGVDTTSGDKIKLH